MTYKKKSKNKYNDLKMASVIGIFGISALGLQISDYLEVKTQALEQTSIAQEVEPISFNEVSEDYLRDNALEVTASEILNDYWAATTRSEWKVVQNEYEDKYLEVTGEVGKIEDKGFEGSYIEFYNTNAKNRFAEWMPIQCKFSDKEEIKQMEELKIGDEVTIVGYSKGSQVVKVALYDCEIKEIQP